MRQSVYFDIFDNFTFFIIRKNWNTVILNQKAMFIDNIMCQKLEIIETLSKKVDEQNYIWFFCLCFNGKKKTVIRMLLCYFCFVYTYMHFVSAKSSLFFFLSFSAFVRSYLSLY